MQPRSNALGWREWTGICAGLLLTAVGAQAQTVRVSGRLTTPDGRMLLSGAVMMAPADERGSAISPEEVRILPNGEFTFGRVPPGRYQIRARGLTQTNGPTLFATFTLVVETRDISNVEMSLRPGTNLRGQVVVERRHPKATLALGSLTVRAPLVDGSGFGDALTGRVGRDGSFAIRGLTAGAHHLYIEGLPDSWTIKTVMLQGRDVTDRPFDVAGQPLGDVRVIVVDAASEVAGTVHDAQGQPAREANVLLFSVSPDFWIPGGRRVRLVRADADGRFVVRGLPAGAYLAAAPISIDDTMIRRASALERLRDAAVPFNLSSDEARTTLDLQILR